MINNVITHLKELWLLVLSMIVCVLALFLPGEGQTAHLLLQLCSHWGQKTSPPALEEVQREAVEKERERRQKNTMKKKSDDGINLTEL